MPILSPSYCLLTLRMDKARRLLFCFLDSAF
jgi:hypothetical protein